MAMLVTAHWDGTCAWCGDAIEPGQTVTRRALGWMHAECGGLVASAAVACPATTKAGKPCPIPGEPGRQGWCHVHDPDGKVRATRKRR